VRGRARPPAQNRSISRNERPDTLDPCIKSIRSSNVKIQLPSFPFGCYTNPYLKRRDDRPGHHLAHHEVEQKEPPPGITGALGGKVVANFAARVEVHELAVRQRNVD